MIRAMRAIVRDLERLGRRPWLVLCILSADALVVAIVGVIT